MVRSRRTSAWKRSADHVGLSFANASTALGTIAATAAAVTTATATQPTARRVNRDIAANAQAAKRAHPTIPTTIVRQAAGNR